MKKDIHSKKTKHLGTLNREILELLKDQEANSNKKIDEFNLDVPSMKIFSDIYKHSVPKPKSLGLTFSSLTVTEIKQLSTEELIKFLSGEGHSGGISETTIHLINNELLHRQIKAASKPNWITYASLFLSLIAAVTGIIQLLGSK